MFTYYVSNAIFHDISANSTIYGVDDGSLILSITLYFLGNWGYWATATTVVLLVPLPSVTGGHSCVWLMGCVV